LETFAQNFATKKTANKSDGLGDDITAHDIVSYFTLCSMDIIFQTGFGYETNASNTNYDETLNNIKTLKDITMLR